MSNEAAATGEARLPLGLFVGIDRSSPVPLYHQVSERIEKAIRDDTLPAGSKLENEISLGHRLGLSRPTVRRAIQELVDKGLLVRRRGVGTQVVHGPVTRNVELTSLFEDLERSAQKPTTTLLSRRVEAATPELAETLGIEVGSPTLHISRLRSAYGVPLAILDNVLPEPFVELTEDELVEHGLYQLLRARGVTMRVAKQRIGARAASREEERLLDLSGGAAVLTMSRVAFDAAGRAVEYGRHCYRPDLYTFEITLDER